MKIKKMMEMRCPRCNGRISYTLWSFLDADLNIEETENLRNGSFYKHKCPNCHANVNIYYPLDFIDPNSKTIISYIQSEHGENRGHNYTQRSDKGPFGLELLGFKNRIVYTPQELIQQVREINLPGYHKGPASD